MRSFAGVQEAYKDWQRFSNERAEIPHLEHMIRLPPATVDPPHVQKFRAALAPHFGPARIRALEAHIREFAISLIEPILRRDRCDFVADYARLLPTSVFLDLMGLPKDRLPQFLEWEHDFFRGAMAAREAVFAKILAYLNEFYDWKPAHPAGDLATAMLIARDEHGAPWSREEIVNCSFLLFVAGLDTVVNTLSFIWRYLAEAPAARQYILQNPGKRQVYSGGAPAHQCRGEPVTACAGRYDAGGCRDEGRRQGPARQQPGQPRLTGIRRPLETQFDRNASNQIGFGAGIHKCIGLHLARMEIAITLEEWLQRIPDFTLDPEHEIRGFAGMVMGLSTLPLRIEPRS